jgi:hypothetical protein
LHACKRLDFNEMKICVFKGLLLSFEMVKSR